MTWWYIWGYFILSVITLGAIALLVLSALRHWRPLLGLPLLALVGFELWSLLMWHHSRSGGWVTDPWTSGIPEHGFWGWIWLGLAVVFALVAFFFRWHSIVSSIAAVVAFVFLAISEPVVTWWMWFFLFLGVLVYLLLDPISPLRRPLIMLFSGIAIVIGILGLPWNFSGHLSGMVSSSTLLSAPNVTVTDNKDLTASGKVNNPIQGLAYVWKVYSIDQNKLTEVPNAVTGGTAPEQKLGPVPKAGDYIVKVYGEQGTVIRTETAAPKVTITGPQGQTGATNPNNSVANGCPDTWVIDTSAHPDYAWVENGLQSIATAYKTKTEADARAAANDFVEKAKTVPAEWQDVIRRVTHDVVATSDLVSGGCASSLAAGYVTQVKQVFDKSKIEAVQVPQNATTTGLENGQVVQNATSGITGDRTALKITLPNGEVFYIQEPCGNIATVGSKPYQLPVGHTTQTPVQGSAAGPTSSSSPPAAHSSATASRSSSAPSGSSAPPAAAPSSVPKDVAHASLAQSDTRSTTTRGDLNTQRSTSPAAPATSQAVPSGQSAPVSSAVPPSGSSNPTGVGTSNQGTTGPPPD